jgi:hypothetical protein
MDKGCSPHDQCGEQPFVLANEQLTPDSEQRTPECHGPNGLQTISLQIFFMAVRPFGHFLRN